MLNLGPSAIQGVIFKSTLLKEIGHGAFGRVFLARNKDLSPSGSGSIAIKVVSSKKATADLKEPYLLKLHSEL